MHCLPCPPVGHCAARREIYKHISISLSLSIYIYTLSLSLYIYILFSLYIYLCIAYLVHRWAIAPRDEHSDGRMRRARLHRGKEIKHTTERTLSLC